MMNRGSEVEDMPAASPKNIQANDGPRSTDLQM